MPRYLYLPLAIREWAPRRTPNDPYYSWQWNMERVRAPFAWASATGAELPVIAILDTGVGLTHPDLAPRLVAGWDFVHNDSAPEDDNGHGTHVAGIAAAAGDNAIGVAGMSWNGRIMPVKVLDEHGSGDAEVAMLGVHWAVDHGATIISMSLGTTDASPYLDEAVQYAISHGAIVVAAAGNVGSQLPMGVPVYPAAFPGVIGVGATGQDDTIASFSNRGSFVDVVAPGLQVFSTWLGGGYSFQSGTSMATPHVSGLAALIWAAAPTRSAGQVASALQQGVVDLGAAGWDPIYGYGRIDAPSALARALQLSALTAMAEPAAPAAQPQGPYQAAVVLLRFATGAESASAAAAILANGALAVETTSLGDVFRAQVPVGQEAICLARFSALPEVSWAGLDYIVFALD
jgi:subtilisin family serine protease